MKGNKLNYFFIYSKDNKVNLISKNKFVKKKKSLKILISILILMYL